MSRGRGEEGANAVEFALVLPVLLVLLFGMITGAIAFNQRLAVSHANREAARFAATLPTGEDDAVAVPPAWFESIAQVMIDGAQGELGSSLDAAPPGRTLCVAYVDPVSGWDDDGAEATPPVSPTRSWRLTGARDASNPPVLDTTPCYADGRDDVRVQVVAERQVRIDIIFNLFSPVIRSEGVARYEPLPTYPEAP